MVSCKLSAIRANYDIVMSADLISVKSVRVVCLLMYMVNQRFAVTVQPMIIHPATRIANRWRLHLSNTPNRNWLHLWKRNRPLEPNRNWSYLSNRSRFIINPRLPNKSQPLEPKRNRPHLSNRNQPFEFLSHKLGYQQSIKQYRVTRRLCIGSRTARK